MAELSDHPPTSRRCTPGAATTNVFQLDSHALDGIHEIDVSQISLDPMHPRSEFESSGIKALGQSMKAYGQCVPVILRPGADNESPFVIVAGARRWKACVAAGLPTIRALVVNISSDDRQQITRMQVAENDHREAWSIIEMAHNARRLVAIVGLAEASKILCKSKGRVVKLHTIGLVAADSRHCLARALAKGWLDDVEAAYQLARLSRIDPKSASTLVARWATADGRVGVRSQVTRQMAVSSRLLGGSR